MIVVGKTLAISSIVLAGWFGSNDSGTKDDFDECTIKINTPSSTHNSHKSVWNACIDKHQKKVAFEQQHTLTAKGAPVLFVNGLGVEHYVLKITIKNTSHEKFVTSFKAQFIIPDGTSLTKTFDHLMILNERKEITVPINRSHYLEMTGFLTHHRQELDENLLKAVITDVMGLRADD
ncbi:MAG: hypothetical protein JKY92_00800 [Magnetovibrio sp.]|nr:hypothetical protein [Magnetovibrio sp.]